MGRDNGLDQLIEELQAGQITTLAIVAGEGRAILRAHRIPAPGTDAGWAVDLDCGRPLADTLQQLVGDAHGSGPGRCQRLDNLTRPLVHVLMTCPRAELLRHVVRTVVEDHSARRPTERVAALLQTNGHRVPRRIDLRVPAPAGPPRARSLTLPWLSAAGA